MKMSTLSFGPGALEEEGLLGRFFAEFLDEQQFADFRRIERLVATLQASGQTPSGSPIIRPRDCQKITGELSQIFASSKPYFRTRDRLITERFETVVGSFRAYCSSTYPGEAIAALVLHGEVLLFMGEPAAVLALVTDLALRPYAIENSLHVLELVELYCQAHLRLGTLMHTEISFVALGDWLVASSRSLRSLSTGQIAAKLAPYMQFGPGLTGRQPRVKLVRLASAGLLKAARGHVGATGAISAFIRWHSWRLILIACYRIGKRGAMKRSPFSLHMTRRGPTLVTRCMGGIGDLLMMEPGLEALAGKQKQPVDFAIPRKFFAIFQGNPHVRLIDINGPVIDIARYGRIANLSFCPAARYESQHRPFVKKGRVEIFAAAMGVRRRALVSQGWHINQFIDQDSSSFCDQFLADREFGRRPLVGVQPFSRDSYKDYAEIGQVIALLARDYDVLVFHHVDTALPSGPGIATTAGVPLVHSLALVARLQAMVSVDSAFLHCAAAYEIPVIALFGPTDPRVFTRHHKHITILWKPESFHCVPCWRNEDRPCVVSELRNAQGAGNRRMLNSAGAASFVSSNTVSPCLSAIAPAEVVAAVSDAMVAAA